MSKKSDKFPVVTTLTDKYLIIANAVTTYFERISLQSLLNVLKLLFYTKAEVDGRVTSSLAGTVDNLNYDPGTPALNLIYRANAGPGTYIHFLSAAATPISTIAAEGQVDFIYSTTTGYWTKVSSPQDLTNYARKADFDPIKNDVNK